MKLEELIEELEKLLQLLKKLQEAGEIGNSQDPLFIANKNGTEWDPKIGTLTHGLLVGPDTIMDFVIKVRNKLPDEDYEVLREKITTLLALKGKAEELKRQFFGILGVASLDEAREVRNQRYEAFFETTRANGLLIAQIRECHTVFEQSLQGSKVPYITIPIGTSPLKEIVNMLYI